MILVFHGLLILCFIKTTFFIISKSAINWHEPEHVWHKILTLGTSLQKWDLKDNQYKTMTWSDTYFPHCDTFE